MERKTAMKSAKQESYDIVIIGAGLSGLAAGIRLAHFGQKTLICEQHHRCGGLNSWYERDGITVDSGLHAMTNFVPKTAAKSAPLLKLLRQLRIPYESFELREQIQSSIRFPDAELFFNNDFANFADAIARRFPAEIDRFIEFDRLIMEHDALNLDAAPASARKILAEQIHDPLLIEMLLCPLQFYGSANENDMEFNQFCIMYRSIFHEGFCRPARGMKHIIGILRERFLQCGGELLNNCEIRSIRHDGKRVKELRCASGRTLSARKILSSAGRIETMRMLRPQDQETEQLKCGKLGFVEAVARLPEPLPQSKWNNSICFFSDTTQFHYEQTAEPVDLRSGVICCPNNFKFADSDPEMPPILRATALANPEFWQSLEPKHYQNAKESWTQALLDKVVNVSGIPDKTQIKVIDAFTPKTVSHYTGHINGAVYGSPDKSRKGMTNLDNLFIIGTDQGFLGITGSMLSGISLANLYGLQN